VSELDVFGFPVQIGKVQPPLLPEETLERQRLLDWMAAKIHSRLVLIVADAGHGKTTLLADWSRRTRVHALWYRLDGPRLGRLREPRRGGQAQSTRSSPQHHVAHSRAGGRMGDRAASCALARSGPG
jgi:hypothetical protein